MQQIKHGVCRTLTTRRLRMLFLHFKQKRSLLIIMHHGKALHTLRRIQQKIRRKIMLLPLQWSNMLQHMLWTTTIKISPVRQLDNNTPAVSKYRHRNKRQGVAISRNWMVRGRLRSNISNRFRKITYLLRKVYLPLRNRTKDNKMVCPIKSVWAVELELSSTKLHTTHSLEGTVEPRKKLSKATR